MALSFNAGIHIGQVFRGLREADLADHQESQQTSSSASEIEGQVPISRNLSGNAVRPQQQLCERCAILSTSGICLCLAACVSSMKNRPYHTNPSLQTW